MRRIVAITLIIFAFTLSAAAQKSDILKELGTFVGQVIWEGHDLDQVTIQVYSDSALKKLVSSGFLLNKAGDYRLEVPPGKYYLVAFVDLNKSGEMDEGDGMGMYGIDDWADPNQDKKPIEIARGEIKEDLNIKISAVLADVGGKLQFVPADRYTSTSSIQEDLERISTGISGKVEAPDETYLAKTTVFAYTDLSWKYRVGQVKVNSDGTFAMNLPQGKFYVMAVVDLNDSNLFDAGDVFGIYGIDDLRARTAFPKTVLVESKKFTENIAIKLTGKRLDGGRIIALGDEEQNIIIEAKTAKLKGKVLWKEEEMKNCVVQFYRDPTFTQPVEIVGTNPRGEFTILLPIGEFYVLAQIDRDGDGKYSAGDVIGAYGSNDITQNPPQKLVLKSGMNPDIQIEITASFTQDGQLVSLKEKPIEESTEKISTGISGKVIWDGKEGRSAIILTSASPDMSDPKFSPVKLADDGSYKIALDPGTYYVMAVIDLNGDGEANMGDGVAIYGTMNPVNGDPVPVTVFPDHITEYINMQVGAMFRDESKQMALIDDANRSNLKLQHGEPEDRFSYSEGGKQIEEWYYWTKGIAFKFEQTELGWALLDTEQFTPKKVEETVEKSQERLKLGFEVLYYSSDQVIWGLSALGLRQPLAFGDHPTATLDGTMLVFSDLDGHIRISTADNTEGKIVLKRSEMPEQVVISPDGDFIAYVKNIGGQKKLFIRYARTRDEIQVPMSADQVSDPAWNRSSELLAFAATNPKFSVPGQDIDELPDSSDENQRNIYLYDMVSNQIDPLVLSPNDDAEPSWCPSDPDQLAFSREVDGVRQIFVIRYYSNKPPEEVQITRFGGQNPNWTPDGNHIVYENNGQAWVADMRTGVNKPIVVDGEPVFGRNIFLR